MTVAATLPTTPPPARRPRGRPPRNGHNHTDTRELLIRCGTRLLTEKGVNATGLDEILKQVGVPKGSFYHYFSSKDDFVAATLENYASYFARKLDSHFSNIKLTPLARIEAFVDDACDGVERHQFRRGCLVGNLGQEVATLDDRLRRQLEAIFNDWENRLALCLKAAVAANQCAATTDSQLLAHSFWIGWEGAILRARLQRSTRPMRHFAALFMSALPRS